MQRRLLPISDLPEWMHQNNVQTYGVEVREIEGRGRGIITTAEAEDEGTLFINVPSNLLLNMETVWEHAKRDKHLEEVLEANGEFGKIAMTSPDTPELIGVDNPWTGYIQFLSAEHSLPTFWTEAERQCLWATSLEKHLAAKFQALAREFDAFRAATAAIAWCQRCWWDPVTLTLEDWKVVDSLYRSRSMDFGRSDGSPTLVPVMDMANHASLADYRALYKLEPGRGGAAQLTLEYGQRVTPGDEVTIMYGFERGAGDSVFSYGFIEPGLRNAISLFLALDPPADDPLAAAKMAALELQPGLKVEMLKSTDRATWVSGFIWAMCANEEDGLRIEVVEAVEAAEGQRRLAVTWKGTPVRSAAELELQLQGDRLRDLFRLRAFSLAHDRVQAEIEARSTLACRPLAEKLPAGVEPTARAWTLAQELRRLERGLLQKSAAEFWETIMHLSGRQEVQCWFKAQRAAEEDLDDGTLDAVYPCEPDDWVEGRKAGDNDDDDAPLSEPSDPPDSKPTPLVNDEPKEPEKKLQELSLSGAGEVTASEPW